MKIKHILNNIYNFSLYYSLTQVFQRGYRRDSVDLQEHYTLFHKRIDRFQSVCCYCYSPCLHCLWLRVLSEWSSLLVSGTKEGSQIRRSAGGTWKGAGFSGSRPAGGAVEVKGQCVTRQRKKPTLGKPAGNTTEKV